MSVRTLPAVAIAAVAVVVAVASPSRAGPIGLVTVGDPGNPADPATGAGAVADEYRLGRHEVTNAQYAAFLSAVAADDPAGLYDTAMSGPFGGITRAGAPGAYTYATVAGRSEQPVTFVSWLDAARYTNWLHNGQTTAVASTESGAYDLASAGGDTTTIARSTGARYFLPTRDEWHKAAFYDPAGDADGYWAYATQSNAAPFSDDPTALNTPDNANTANHFKNDFVANGYDGGYATTGTRFLPTVSALTDVGAYAAAPSPWGTFDQAGNVWEWGETLLGPGDTRAYYGGAWDSTSAALAAATQTFGDTPTTSSASIGFRVAAAAESVLSGDYNADGVVDGADYTLWRDGGPLANETASPGVVDGADYAAWVQGFGNASASAASATIVPEPHALAIGFVGLTTLPMLFTRRRHGA